MKRILFALSIMTLACAGCAARVIGYADASTDTFTDSGECAPTNLNTDGGSLPTIADREHSFMVVRVGHWPDAGPSWCILVSGAVDQTRVRCDIYTSIGRVSQVEFHGDVVTTSATNVYRVEPPEEADPVEVGSCGCRSRYDAQGLAIFGITTGRRIPLQLVRIGGCFVGFADGVVPDPSSTIAQHLRQLAAQYPARRDR